MKSNLKVKAKVIHLICAVMLLIVGVAVLSIGLFAPPFGSIDNSVLVAFGEILTFVGSIFGIDYNYRYKMTKLNFDREADN